MKEISIIIVSYNEIEYIEEAIESCLSQKGINDYEIIIGDDGSTDGSINLINEYTKRYPDIIKSFVMPRNEDNKDVIAPLRVSNTVKKAIELSTGKYVTMLSGDDYLIDDNKLKTQIDCLDNDPKLAACYTDYLFFWPDGTTEEKYSKFNFTGNIIWAVCYIHISCFVFTRDVIPNLLETFCDDCGAFFSIINTGKIKHIEMMGFAYRQRDKSIMHASDDMELSILELLLFQDVLNTGSYIISSLPHFAKYLKYIVKHRELLEEKKYNKYRKLGKSKNNDILTDISSSKSIIKYYLLIALSDIVSFCFRAIKKITLILFNKR